MTVIAAPPDADLPAADDAPPGGEQQDDSEGGPDEAPKDLAAPRGLTPPVLLTVLSVEYPASLADDDDPPSGDVEVRFVIGTDGTTEEIEIGQSLHEQLDGLAADAVASARYTPATLDGSAVEIATSLRFRFDPPPAAPPPDPELEVEPTLEALPVAEVEPASALPVRISGVVLEGGVRRPVAKVSVLAIPGAGLNPGRVRARQSKRWQEAQGDPAWVIEATTGDDGSFELRGVPEGRVLLVFIAQDFERLEYALDIVPGTVSEGKYYATRVNENPYRTVVETEQDRPAEITRREISTEELTKIPGTAGDPLKGLQNFPGMARAPFGAGALLIRGAGPGDSAVYLGGHELPTLFHFGALQSVFNADMIDSIAYVPSNFDSPYGDATGGMVDVTPKVPSRDGFHGYVDADLYDASTLLRGPVGKGSFAVAVRRSYVDTVLRAFDAVPLAPRYIDYQGLFDYPIGPGHIGVRLLGIDDKFIALSDIADGFQFTSAFHRADLYYRQRVRRWSLYVSPSFAYVAETQAGTGEQSYNTSVRVEATYRQSERFDVTFGTETRAGVAALSLTSPGGGGGGFGGGGGGGGFGGGDGVEAVDAVSETAVPYATPAVYATGSVRVGELRPVTVSPGVRVTAYATPMGRVIADPRLNAKWEVADRWTLKTGVGMYSQAPELLELDTTFGNPELDPENSAQSSLGVSWELPYDINVELTGFYKYLWNVVTPSDRLVDRDGQTVPERFANSGIGHSYGGEALLRRDFSKRIYGWVAYTLSRTQLRERTDAALQLAPFDQTHILNVIAGYKLPRNWNIGLRFRLTSGNPTTPLANGIYDSTSGGYTPFAAPANSDRLPAFHQLDLRVDKTWTLRLTKIMAYLDVQNLYNAKNAEFFVPSYNYEETARVNSLPIFPSLGLRLDF